MYRILILALLLSSCAAGNVNTRLESIEKKLDAMHPKNPNFSVMHGWYQDFENPKNSGFRMIRTKADGTLLIEMKVIKAEKKDDRKTSGSPGTGKSNPEGGLPGNPQG